MFVSDSPNASAPAPDGAPPGSASPDATGLEALAEAIDAALDGLLAVDPARVGDDELAAAVVDLRRQQARLAAATVELTAAFDARRVWAGSGSTFACFRVDGGIAAATLGGGAFEGPPGQRDTSVRRRCVRPLCRTVSRHCGTRSFPYLHAEDRPLGTSRSLL
jgi:hypothetical protein